MSEYSIDDLVRLTGLTKRTIRYYIQTGLVARPEGERRAAYYGERHLETLLRVKRLTAEGFSLERVKALIDAPERVPSAAPAPGSVTVRSHIHLAPGVELSVDPLEAGLTNEELRALVRVLIERLAARQSQELP